MYQIALLAALITPPLSGGKAEFTEDFGLERVHIMLPAGGNDYFSLQPGRFLRLEGDDDGEWAVVEIRVLNEIKPIFLHDDDEWLIAFTRVVEEREWKDDELVEVSRNYFARRPGTGDIYYFGEAVDIYEDGEVVGHDGSWIAGCDDAEPGLIMPSVFLLGARYFQEIAPDVAMDRAEHVEMDLQIETPLDDFDDCVKIVETSPLEPGHESIKYYAPGIGLIVDGSIRLTAFHP